VGSDYRQLVSEYIQAVGDGRLDDLSAYLGPEVTFESPGLPSLHGAHEYVAALRRLAPVIARNEIKRIFVDGNEACVFYDFVTDTPAGAVASVEWLTIADGRINAVYLIFDKARWPEVLEQLGLTAAKA
jgi:limonene-1,2-epoxide hydrolase